MRKPSWILAIMARHGVVLSLGRSAPAKHGRRRAWAKRFGGAGAWSLARQGVALRRSLVTVAVVASTGIAFAGITNTIPYSDNFENYTNGTPLIDGTNGWYGDSSAIVVQTSTVRAGTNAAMIPVDCTLSNRFQSTAPTNVWIQMDAAPVWYNNDITNYPIVDTNTVCLFYVNSNGNFMVHNGPASPDPTNSANWMTLPNFNVGTTWVRINIYVDFAQTNWDLYADGALVTNNIGFVNTTLTNFTRFDTYNGATTSYLDNVSVAAMDTNQYPLIVLPPALAASVFVGRTPPIQTVQVINVWSDNIGFRVTTNEFWLSASPANGTATNGTTQNVSVTYASTVTSWPAGAISNAIVTIVATNASGGAWDTQTVAVTMSIMELQVTPTNITDTVAVGATPTNRDFYVINAGAGSFSYTATITNTCNWLSLSSTSGTASAFSTNTLTLTYSNTTGWTAGTSNATVTIVSGNDGGATQTVSVALTLSMALQTAPAQLTNAIMQGETASTNFQVWVTNPGFVSYSVITNQAWLVLSQVAGSLTGQTANATNTIGVAFTNTSGLTVGTHYGMITISAPGCANVTINVMLTVRAMPMLGVSPMLVTNTVMEGQNVTSQVLRVWNGSADDGIGFQVTTNATWLTVQLTNNYLAPLATNTFAINYAVSLNTSAGDAPSNYFGTITVTATNVNGSPANGSPVIIPVSVTANPRSRLALSLTNLSPTVLQGQDAASQSFDVWNANGFYTLAYTITKNASWLFLTPTNGTSTGQYARIEVQYSTANLPAGITNALITVVGRASGGSYESSARDATQTIVVALSVTPTATLMTDAQSAYAYTVRKGVIPSPTVFNVWNGANLPGGMYFMATPSASWLSMTPASGTSTGDMVEIRVQADPTDMSLGVVYRGTVQIDATDAGSGTTAYGSPSYITIAIVVRNFKGFDFQGGLSGASDLVLYREANGAWEIRNLLSNYATTQFLGGAGYQAAPGDYTGDGVTWMGVYRPASGSWYAQQVGAGSAQGMEIQQWAGDEYVGMPGDYDGDGITDLGVYLEQSGLWMALLSSDNYQPDKQVSGIFGGPGYTALLAGDYDGDCKTDPGVYHRASGLWYVLFSTSQSVVSGIFGGNGFTPVPTDYDGDGITDPAVYATETGRWYILPSTTLTSQGYSLSIYQFGGAATLLPAPGNYDGVGGADLGLYDTSTWRWYIITLDGVPLAWGYPMGRLGCLPVLP